VSPSGKPEFRKDLPLQCHHRSASKTGNTPALPWRRRGGTDHKGYDIRLFDLPGTYSLTAYSLDEIVARDFLIKERPT
jgi:ferrous iron transport protein B